MPLVLRYSFHAPQSGQIRPVSGHTCPRSRGNLLPGLEDMTMLGTIERISAGEDAGGNIPPAPGCGGKGGAGSRWGNCAHARRAAGSFAPPRMGMKSGTCPFQPRLDCRHCQESRHHASSVMGAAPKMSGRNSWREIPVIRSMSRTRSAGTRVQEYNAVCLMPSARASAVTPPALLAAFVTISIMIAIVSDAYAHVKRERR